VSERTTASQVRIRPLREQEVALLPDFLYLAIHVPEGISPPPRSVVHDPALAHYYVGFNPAEVTGDVAVCAVDNDRVIGIAWSRILDGELPGYGNIGPGIPEAGWAVVPDYRNQGIGTKLIGALLNALSNKGFAQVSLSVQKTNPAARLYQRFGFQTISENDEDYIMKCELPTLRDSHN